MTLDEFHQSLTATEPPAGLTLALAGLWWDGKGDWTRASGVSGPIIIVQAHRLSTSRLPLNWQKAIDAGRLLLVSPFQEKDRRVTKELVTERNRFVVTISDEVLIPYAAPDSKTGTLFQDAIASGKRVYTFESPANAAMISAGAVAIAPDFFSRRSASSVPA